MDIQPVTHNKKQYLDLLLLADEQEDMIDRYLDRGELFTLTDQGEVRCVAVVAAREDGDCELKNIATAPKWQGKGYGKAMIAHLCGRYRGRYQRMYVGTGDVPRTTGFYRSCGFADAYRVKNFFTDHYREPMVEEGVLLVDMVYFVKDL